jgi:hypothetical protein
MLSLRNPVPVSLFLIYLQDVSLSTQQEVTPTPTTTGALTYESYPSIISSENAAIPTPNLGYAFVYPTLDGSDRQTSYKDSIEVRRNVTAQWEPTLWILGWFRNDSSSTSHVVTTSRPNIADVQVQHIFTLTAPHWRRSPLQRTRFTVYRLHLNRIEITARASSSSPVLLAQKTTLNTLVSSTSRTQMIPRVRYGACSIQPQFDDQTFQLPKQVKR